MFAGKLLRLLHLCDPALPIGGFSHSYGLETYVQQGVVHDKDTAAQFINQQLSQNICFTDAAFVSLAYDAATTDNFEKIMELDEHCTALKISREVRQGSNKLGIRLLKIFNNKDEHALSNKYLQSTKGRKSSGHYSIAFGLLAAEMFIDKTDTLTGFFYNAAAGFVVNCVKLIPLGQQDGQSILMSFFPLIDTLVESCSQPDENRIGICCPAFDIRCMQHEQLYSRLYMS